jgi:hypothetical protein
MHPDIKKFWEKLGIVRKEDKIFSGYTNVPLYFLDKNGTTGTEIIAAPWLSNDNLCYQLGGKWYFEKEALKVIKMKAFI